MKIKYHLLERLKNLTNKELEFLLYVARYQDETGRICGIYYWDICKNVGMCKQTFYNTMRSLQGQGIISYEKASEVDYDIRILDNDFSYKGSLQEGYIMLNRHIFRSKGFKHLKSKEKFMLLDLMKITHCTPGKFVIGRETFYKKYSDLLGVSMRVIRYYLHNLRTYFEVWTRSGKYYISYIRSKFEEIRYSGLRQYREFSAKAILRRCGMKIVTSKNLKDMADMIQQYTLRAEEQGHDICQLLKQAVRAAVNEQEKPVFNAKRVHMLLKKCFN